MAGCLELTLWQAQSRRDTGAPLSLFLHDALDWLWRDNRKIPCVFSLTDPAQQGPDGKPHNGEVYQWSGFSKLGESRVTDLWRVRAPVESCRRRRTLERAKVLNPKSWADIQKSELISYSGLTRCDALPPSADAVAQASFITALPD